MLHSLYIFSYNQYLQSYLVLFNKLQYFHFEILMVSVENSQLQFEPFRSGRDGQVGTGIWSVGNVGRIGCGNICRSLSRLRRASVACQDMSIECGNVSIECGSLQGISWEVVSAGSGCG